jgi:hypothetical protein
MLCEGGCQGGDSATAWRRGRATSKGSCDVVERRGGGFWAGRAPHVVGTGIRLWIVSTVSVSEREKNTRERYWVDNVYICNLVPPLSLFFSSVFFNMFRF